MSTATSNYFSGCGRLIGQRLTGYSGVATSAAANAAGINCSAWCADSITAAGTFTLTGAANLSTYGIIDKALLKQDTSYVAVYRLGLIKVLGIVSNSCV